LAESSTGFSRRTFLTGAGATGALTAVGLAVGVSGCTREHGKPANSGSVGGDGSVVAFRGAHQAGIITKDGLLAVWEKPPAGSAAMTLSSFGGAIDEAPWRAWWAEHVER